MAPHLSGGCCEGAPSRLGGEGRPSAAGHVGHGGTAGALPQPEPRCLWRACASITWGRVSGLVQVNAR
eukprot:10939077-Alexandrium_andersonii.AAC.1